MNSMVREPDNSQRAYGLDVDAVRAEMQSPAHMVIEEFGQGHGTIIGAEGLRKFFKNGVLVTVKPKAKNPRRRHRVEADKEHAEWLAQALLDGGQFAPTFLDEPKQVSAHAFGDRLASHPASNRAVSDTKPVSKRRLPLRPVERSSGLDKQFKGHSSIPFGVAVFGQRAEQFVHQRFAHGFKLFEVVMLGNAALGALVDQAIDGLDVGCQRAAGDGNVGLVDVVGREILLDVTLVDGFLVHSEQDGADLCQIRGERDLDAAEGVLAAPVARVCHVDSVNDVLHGLHRDDESGHRVFSLVVGLIATTADHADRQGKKSVFRQPLKQLVTARYESADNNGVIAINKRHGDVCQASQDVSLEVGHIGSPAQFQRTHCPADVLKIGRECVGANRKIVH